MIRSEQIDRVTLLRIDRHEQRNALNGEHVEALLQALQAAVEAGALCVVLTGEGSAFCAGADLDTVEDRAFRERLALLMRTIAQLPIPVIAAVNGPAIGAGTQLAVACDLRVAAPAARFMVPMAKLGVAVDQWTVRRAMSLTGAGTRAMLLGADSLDATRAHTLGLVDRLGTLDDALAWAQEITQLAPLTVQYVKLAVHAATELQLDDPQAEQALERCWASEDLLEAMQARVQRRAPVFQGR